jgi:hypothetical protein
MTVNKSPCLPPLLSTAAGRDVAMLLLRRRASLGMHPFCGTECRDHRAFYESLNASVCLQHDPDINPVMSERPTHGDAAVFEIVVRQRLLYPSASLTFDPGDRRPMIPHSQSHRGAAGAHVSDADAGIKSPLRTAAR